jgi:SNF2 family DNA or RNA helicase
VILDEAQHIKNPLSQTARAAKKLASERRLALTGTPIENRLSELWSIFDFVSPGLLGQLKTFEEKVARPIDRGDNETARRLRNTIQPFVLRRLKKDVAVDLPAKIEQEIVVPLADSQQALYKQILEQVRKSVLSEVETQGHRQGAHPDPGGAHAPASGGLRPAPHEAGRSGLRRRRQRQAGGAPRDRERGRGRRTTACWCSASSCRCCSSSARRSTPTA